MDTIRIFEYGLSFEIPSTKLKGKGFIIITSGHVNIDKWYSLIMKFFGDKKNETVSSMIYDRGFKLEEAANIKIRHLTATVNIPYSHTLCALMLDKSVRYQSKILPELFKISDDSVVRIASLTGKSQVVDENWNNLMNIINTVDDTDNEAIPDNITSTSSIEEYYSITQSDNTSDIEITQDPTNNHEVKIDNMAYVMESFKSIIDGLVSRITGLETTLVTKQDSLASKQDAIATKQDAIATKQDAIATKQDSLASKQDAIASMQGSLASKQDALASKQDIVADNLNTLTDKHEELTRKMEEQDRRIRALELRANNSHYNDESSSERTVEEPNVNRIAYHTYGSSSEQS